MGLAGAEDYSRARDDVLRHWPVVGGSERRAGGRIRSESHLNYELLPVDRSRQGGGEVVRVAAARVRAPQQSLIDPHGHGIGDMTGKRARNGKVLRLAGARLKAGGILG